MADASTVDSGAEIDSAWVAQELRSIAWLHWRAMAMHILRQALRQAEGWVKAELERRAESSPLVADRRWGVRPALTSPG